MKNVIGVDIGGTKVAVGKFNIKGDKITESVIPFNNKLSPEEMMDLIFGQIDDISDENTSSLGFGIPGPLKLGSGQIGNPPNLKSWHDFKVIDYIQSKTKIPFYIENDANVAALAEHLYNNEQNFNNTIYITISTGIGSGIIINNQLLSGTNGNAGEIGHISVDPNSEIICSTCGQRGCLENLASGTAISNILSAKLARNINAKEAFDLYRHDNPIAIEVIDKAIEYISQAIVTMINLFDTDQISIGGGVSNNSDILIPKITSNIAKYALSEEGKKVVIKKALYSDAGLIGAASLAINND